MNNANNKSHIDSNKSLLILTIKVLKAKSKSKKKLLVYSCYLIFSLIMTACSNVNTNDHNSTKNQNYIYTDSAKFVMLISETIELPKLQQYFGGSCREQQLIILNNHNFKGVDKLTKFGKSVVLMTQEQINNTKIIFYIKYKLIKIKNNSAYVEYYYSGQNIDIVSSYIFENNHWNIVESVLLEH